MRDHDEIHRRSWADGDECGALPQSRPVNELFAGPLVPDDVAAAIAEGRGGLGRPSRCGPRRPPKTSRACLLAVVLPVVSAVFRVYARVAAGRVGVDGSGLVQWLILV
jgi:hypothetical protein